MPGKGNQTRKRMPERATQEEEDKARAIRTNPNLIGPESRKA